MRKAMDDETTVKLAAKIDALLWETRQLRTDVATLHGRIHPFEGEQLRTFPAYEEPIKTLPDALRAIEAARKDIREVEYDFRFIRSAIDQIRNDAWSRDELKKWLIEPGRTRPKN